jgi:hypothetical protein
VIDTKKEGRPWASDCKACSRRFDTYYRIVQGPHGPMKIEEDLCPVCRRSTLFYFDHEDIDESTAAEEEADLLFLELTGLKRETASE